MNPLVLLIPGQGSQHRSMVRGLYGWDDTFTEAADAAFEALDEVGQRVRHAWLTNAPEPGIDSAACAQPMLFVAGYALGSCVRRWARPDAYLGHSAGELVAAILGGLLSLAEGAQVMLTRASVFDRLPAGGMVAVAAGWEEIAPVAARTGCDLAAINGPRQTMYAGPTRALQEFCRALAGEGRVFAPIASPVPFHSGAMRPAAEAVPVRTFRTGSAPGVVFSAFTGEPLTAAQAGSSTFWARHLTDPVRFGPTLATVQAQLPGATFVEAGPGQTLSGFVRRTLQARSGAAAVVPMSPVPAGGVEADRATFIAARDALAPRPRERTIRAS